VIAWLRQLANIRKVAGPIPGKVIWFFSYAKLSSCSLALGLTAFGRYEYHEWSWGKEGVQHVSLTDSLESLSRLFRKWVLIFVSIFKYAKIQGSLWIFVTGIIIYSERLLTQRPTPKLKAHSLSAVRSCLFAVLAATHHSWRLSSPSASRGHTMPWWQGAHLTWHPNSVNGDNLNKV
jgi:hypothetical protein